MKKLMSLVLALAMILSLAACGGKTTGTSPDSAGDSQQETPATSDGAFPEKQITIIMPWSLGGGPDTIARQVASYGEKYLGVPVIVENHTGGSGTIAMNDALQAEDDGYTMVVANGPLFSLTPSFINVNYTLDDITPLIGMRITEFVVLTNSKSGITNIDELKAYAAEGNTIKYATTGGPGNDSYTMISVLFKLLDIPAEPVPYDGGQEAINALVGGHVDVDFTGMDYFAVRSSVDDSKKEVLTNFIAEVYADPEFQEFMKGMGMEAWEATESEIVDMVEAQTEAMTEYIPLVQ